MVKHDHAIHLLILGNIDHYLKNVSQNQAINNTKNFMKKILARNMVDPSVLICYHFNNHIRFIFFNQAKKTNREQEISKA
jgi:hypothetical protein